MKLSEVMPPRFAEEFEALRAGDSLLDLAILTWEREEAVQADPQALLLALALQMARRHSLVMTALKGEGRWEV